MFFLSRAYFRASSSMSGSHQGIRSGVNNGTGDPLLSTPATADLDFPTRRGEKMIPTLAAISLEGDVIEWRPSRLLRNPGQTHAGGLDRLLPLPKIALHTTTDDVRPCGGPSQAPG